MSCRVSDSAHRMAETTAGGSAASTLGWKIEFAPPLGRCAMTCGGPCADESRDARLSGRRFASTAPRIELPTVPPRFLQNWIWLDATPRYFRGSATCTAVRYSG